MKYTSLDVSYSIFSLRKCTNLTFNDLYYIEYIDRECKEILKRRMRYPLLIAITDRSKMLLDYFQLFLYIGSIIRLEKQSKIDVPIQSNIKMIPNYVKYFGKMNKYYSTAMVNEYIIQITVLKTGVKCQFVFR